MAIKCDSRLFGELMWRRRLEKNIAISYLAKKTGYSTANITKFETGGHVPRLDAALIIAEELGFKLEFLHFGKFKKPVRHATIRPRTPIAGTLGKGAILLGRAIKGRRVEMDLSSQALANQLGINRSTVSHWESGRSIAKEDLYLKLIKILDLDPLEHDIEEIRAEATRRRRALNGLPPEEPKPRAPKSQRTKKFKQNKAFVYNDHDDEPVELFRGITT